MILRFAEKLGQVRDTRTERGLGNKCKWSEKWQMKFNIAKCKVIHIGAKNLGAGYEMED